MARVDLFCPYCETYVTTLLHGFMQPMYECEGCGRDVRDAELVRVRNSKLALAGAGRMPTFGTQPRGTASGSNNVTVPNVALVAGDWLVVAVFEWHSGAATVPASVTWGATPLSTGDTTTTAQVLCTYYTLFDISELSPQNIVAVKNDAAVQFITISAISGSNLSNVLRSGGNSGTTAAASCSLTGTGSPALLQAWSASYNPSGPSAGDTGTWTSALVAHTETAVVSGWPTSDYTIDAADSFAAGADIPAGAVTITKSYPVAHNWAIMLVGLA